MSRILLPLILGHLFPELDVIKHVSFSAAGAMSYLEGRNYCRFVTVKQQSMRFEDLVTLHEEV